MSVTVMGLAWYVKGLTPAQKVVLVALADHADDDGMRVYPGVKRLTIKTSLKERTVRRSLGDLRKMGILVVVKESTFHSPTEYRIDLPQMQSLQNRPARDASQDLPETTERPARDAGKPSINHNSKPSKKRSRKRDPRLNNPAIIAYREEAHLHVPINIRDDGVSIVSDAEKWQGIVHSWMAKGWNKQNIEGMLDVYRDGWRDGKAKGKKGVDLSAFDKIRQREMK